MLIQTLVSLIHKPLQLTESMHSCQLWNFPQDSTVGFLNKRTPMSLPLTLLMVKLKHSS